MEKTAPAAIRWYLKEWRLARGWSQTELGALMDATKSQISKLEKEPGDKHATQWDGLWLARAAAAFKVQPTELLFPPDKPSPAELLRPLTQEQQNAVVDLARTVKKAS